MVTSAILLWLGYFLGKKACTAQAFPMYLRTVFLTGGVIALLGGTAVVMCMVGNYPGLYAATQTGITGTFFLLACGTFFYWSLWAPEALGITAAMFVGLCGGLLGVLISIFEALRLIGFLPPDKVESLANQWQLLARVSFGYPVPPDDVSAMTAFLAVSMVVSGSLFLSCTVYSLLQRGEAGVIFGLMLMPFAVLLAYGAAHGLYGMAVTHGIVTVALAGVVYAALVTWGVMRARVESQAIIARARDGEDVSE